MNSFDSLHRIDSKPTIAYAESAAIQRSITVRLVMADASYDNADQMMQIDVLL